MKNKFFLLVLSCLLLSSCILFFKDTKGSSSDYPLIVKYNMDLGDMGEGSGWQSILEEIAEKRKYVCIDLTECTMIGTEFNPNKISSDHKYYIVKIAFPDTVEKIADGSQSDPTFKGMFYLDFFMGKGLAEIGDYAFYEFNSLNMSSLPAGLTYIGDYAFSGCRNLSIKALPKGINHIGTRAFEKCGNISLNSLPAEITTIRTGTFEECSKISKMSIPNGVTVIGNFAFNKCSNLSQVTLPETLTDIGNEAFNYTNLTQISLPESITGIYSKAFFNCTKMNLIICKAAVPPLLSPNAIPYNWLLDEKFQIKVPAGSVNTYKKNKDWQSFSDVISAL